VLLTAQAAQRKKEAVQKQPISCTPFTPHKNRTSFAIGEAGKLVNSQEKLMEAVGENKVRITHVEEEFNEFRNSEWVNYAKAFTEAMETTDMKITKLH
jgi:hypothetical protein